MEIRRIDTLEETQHSDERILSKELKVDKKLELSIKNFYEELGITLSKEELESDDGSKGIEYIISKSLELISPLECSKKEQTLEEIKKSLQYPNNYVFASLAERSYSEKKKLLNKDENLHGKKILGDWILLTGAYHNFPGIILGNVKSLLIDNIGYHLSGGLVGDPNGYFGVAYWNPQMQQVIIAHRGTENVAALATDSIDSIVSADIHGIILNEHVGQIDSAITFTDKVIRVLKKINNKKGLKIQLFFTGHSLGAWLAPITAFSAKYLENMGDYFAENLDFEETGYHTSTVIFDGPGSRNILERIQDRLMSRSCASLISSLDIISYLSAPNVINACNPQVGDLYRVFIHISDEEKKSIWKMKFNYNLFVHNITRIKNVFDPQTGDVLEDEDGNLKVKKVEDWPTLLPENPTSEFLEKLVNSFAAQLTFAFIPAKHILCNVGKAVTEFAINKIISKPIKWHLEVKPELNNFFKLANEANNFHVDNKAAHIMVGDNHFRMVRYKTQSLDQNDKNVRKLNVFTRSERQFLERYKLLQEYQNVPSTFKLTKLFDVFGDEDLKNKFMALLEECEIKNGNVYSNNLSEFIPYIKRLLHFFPKLKNDLDEAFQNSSVDIVCGIYQAASSSYLEPVKESLNTVKDTFGLKAFLEDNIRFLCGIHSSTFLGSVKIYKTLNVIKTSYCHFFLNFDRIFYLEDSLLVSFIENVQHKCLLVIDCDETPSSKIERFLNELFNALKKNVNVKVILVMETDSSINMCDISGGMLYQEKTLETRFSDLTPDSQKKFLEEKTIIFQGKEVPLSTVLNSNSDDDLANIIDPATIADLYNNKKIEIGKPLPSLGEVGDYYIDRKLVKKVKVNEEILRDENLTDLFTISNVDKVELSQMVNGAKVRSFDEDDDRSNPVRFIKLNENAEANFKKLCDAYSDYTIHWLKKFDNGDLIWQKSHGKTLFALRRYMGDYDSDLSEDEYSANNASIKITDVCGVDGFDEKLIIVAAEPGMGKTTVLTRLGIQSADDSKWLIRINLIEHRDKLEQTDFSDEERVVTFLYENDTVSNTLEKKLLESRIEKSGNIVFLLDGFDEITSKGQKSIVNLLKILQGTKVEKILISTRLHLRNELENSLSTVAYTLKPFFRPDQEEFLKKFWQRKIDPAIDPNHLDNYITELLRFISNSIGDKERKFMGIPMQMRMVAEAFGEELENLLNGLEFVFPEKFDMLELYNKFINAKYRAYLKKKGADVKSVTDKEMALITKGFNKVLRYLAIEELFPKLGKDLLGKKIPSLEDKQVMNLVGIAQIIDNRTTFTHRSFGEYFAACFMIKILSKKDSKYAATINFLSKELFKGKCELTRTFLDYLIAKNDVHVAILKGKLDDVERSLSDLNIDIEAADILGRNVLHYAAQEGYHEIVDCLLKKGAGVVADKLGKTPLHYAARYNHGPQAVTCLLKEAKYCINCEDNNKRTAVYYAAKQGDWEIVDCILTQKGAGAEGLDNKKLLFHYTYKGNLDGVQNIFKQKKLPIAAARDNQGNTLLHVATQKGHSTVVEFLLEEGADVSTANGSGKTPINYAAENKHWGIVESLLRKGAEIMDLNDAQKLLLMKYSAKNAHWDIVKLFMVDNDGNNYFSLLDSQQSVQFLCESISSEDFTIAEFLINKGTNVNDSDKNSKRPIHYAGENECWNIVELLLEKGATLKDLNNNQKIALFSYCSQNCHLKTVKLFMEDYDMWDNYITYLSCEQTIYCLRYTISIGNLNITKFFIKQLNFCIDDNTHDEHKKTFLHLAAENGQLNMVKYLVEEEEANLNSITDCESTPLHLAVKNGHLETVNYLVKIGADIYLCNENRENAIDISKSKGHKSIEELLSKVYSTHKRLFHDIRSYSIDPVRSFIENNNDCINFKYRYGFTLLHIAARECNDLVLRYLIEKGAGIEIRDNSGNNVLHWSAFMGEKRAISRLLPCDSVSVVSGNNVCKWHVQNEKVQQVHVLFDKYKKEMLLEKVGTSSVDCFDYGEVLCCSCEEDENGLTAVEQEKSSNACLIIKYLLDTGKIDPNIRNSFGNTVLHILSLTRCPDALKYLIDGKGADVHLTNENNSTPLHFASSKDVAQCLLERGADIYAVNKHRNVPLHYAAMYGYLDVAEYLVQQGAHLDIKNIDGNTPLHCAVENKKLHVVKHLIASGADCTVRNADGKTAKDLSTGEAYTHVLEEAEKKMLLIAADWCNLNMVRNLVESGVNIDSTDEYDHTPLHYAVRGGYLELVEYLLEKGANVFAQNIFGDVLIYAVECGKEEILKLVLNKIIERLGNIDEYVNSQRKYSQNTPLMTAVAVERINQDKILLEFNPHIETQNVAGMTALHLSAAHGPAGFAELLVGSGANIHAVDIVGRKPIHVAALNGHVNVIELFLNEGVEVDDTDEGGWTPLHYAVCSFQEAAAEFLVGRGANVSARSENGRGVSELTVARKTFAVEEEDNVFWGPFELDLVPVDFEAEDILHEAEEINSDNLEFYIDKAENLHSEGAYKDALHLFNVIFNIQRSSSILGCNDQATLKTRMKIGVLHSKLDKYEKAKGILEKVHKLQLCGLANLRTSHADTVTTHQNIAAVLYKQGRYEDALSIYEQVLETRKEILRENHPDILLTRHHIARVLNKQGKHKEALEMFEEVFRLQSQALGTDDPDTLKTWINIPLTFCRLGEYEKASSVLQEIFEKGGKLIESQHPAYLTVHYVSVLLLLESCEYEKALNTLESILEIQEKFFGPDHSDSLATKHEIARTLHLQGKNEEALKIFCDVYDERKKVLGSDHENTLSTYNYINSIESRCNNSIDSKESRCNIQ